MALIKCPECGKEFSSYATACPQCGFPVESMNENLSQLSSICPECGATCDNNLTVCPNCGCPINEDKRLISQVLVNVPKKKKSKRGWLIGGIAAGVLFLVVGTFLFLGGTKNISRGFFDANVKSDKSSKVETTENEIDEPEITDPFLEKGWNFLLNKLKAPSTASLVGYISPDEALTRDLANEIGMNGIKIAVFQVDAQNGFGAMIRTTYYVFFRNGEPRVVMDEGDVLKAGNMSVLRGALSYAGL